jgi:hypothetical protein
MNFNVPILEIFSDGKTFFFEFTRKSYQETLRFAIGNFPDEREFLHIEGDLLN